MRSLFYLTLPRVSPRGFNYGGVRESFREVGSCWLSVTATNIQDSGLTRREGAVVKGFPSNVRSPRFDPRHQQRENTYFGLWCKSHRPWVTWLCCFEEPWWWEPVVSRPSACRGPHTRKRKEFYCELPAGQETSLLTQLLTRSTTSQ